MPDDCCGTIVNHFVEQPHLGREIFLHRLVIIEVVAAEIGEGAGRNSHPFVAILREAMARRFIGDMRHALARQTAHIRKESHDVGRGKPGRNAFVGRGNAQRPDARGALARHAPDLARHFDGRSLAVGPRHRDNRFGYGREELCGDTGEGAARFVIGDMDCAFDLRFGSGYHGNRAGIDGVCDKIFGIEASAAEGSKNRARGNLAVIDGKTRYFDVRHFGSFKSGLAYQPFELHCCAPGISGAMSEISTSRELSGCTPRIGPMRGTRRPTIGAAFHAAVRWNELATVPRGSSSMAITT